MRNSKRSGILCQLVIVAFITGGFAGCAKTGSSYSSNNNAITYVTLMNLAPYAPSTEIYLNGTKATSAVAPGQYSTTYAHLTPGAYHVQFKVAGGDSVMAELASSNYDSLGFYSLILYNNAGGGPAQAVKIVDDFSTVSVTSANYRFFNLCPDAPSVDLYLNTTAVQTNRGVADNVSGTFFNIFEPVSAQVYSIQVKKAGTDSVIAQLSNVNLVAATATTIFLSGSKKNTADPISVNTLNVTY